MSNLLKPLRWVASAKKDLAAMPADVQDTFGYALHLAQSGDKHADAKPLKGFGGAGVLEVVEDYLGGLVHISQLSEDHVAKVKDVLKVGQEVEARVIKVDKVERRIGLSIKAANYSEEELRRESEAFDNLRPGEDMVGLEKAFEAAEEDYRPGEGKKK